MVQKSSGIVKKAEILIFAVLLFALCTVLLYVTKIYGAMPSPDPGGSGVSGQEAAKADQSDYWTVAIFGLDGRDGSLGKGNSADAQILCSINKTNGEVRLVSVYRDTFLMNSVSEKKYGKISDDYFLGGPEAAAEALSANFDLPVKDYLSFSWKAAAEAVDLLGGIDVDITESEFKYMNAFITETVRASGIPSTQIKGPGINHLDGVQTVAYCRLRLPDSDMARTDRQRKVLELALAKAKKADPLTLLQVIRTVLSQTETSITHEDALNLAKQIGSLHIVKSTGFPFEYTPADMGKMGTCLLPKTLETNVEQLHRFLYGEEGYHCSDRVKEIDREILKQAVKN